MLEGGGGGEGVLGEGEGGGALWCCGGYWYWLLVLVTGTMGTWQLDGYYGIGRRGGKRKRFWKQGFREG